MNDLINRQEAIKALGERPPLWTGGDYELGRADQYDADLEALKSVSTVQPSEAADLIIINKQEVIDAVIKECNADGAYGYMDAKSIIDLLNRLSESIIRCKYCALWDNGKCNTWSALGVTIMTAETGYCNFGDRRDDG